MIVNRDFQLFGTCQISIREISQLIVHINTNWNYRSLLHLSLNLYKTQRTVLLKGQKILGNKIGSSNSQKKENNRQCFIEKVNPSHYLRCTLIQFSRSRNQTFIIIVVLSLFSDLKTHILVLAQPIHQCYYLI